jgi:hypothetical protein
MFFACKVHLNYRKFFENKIYMLHLKNHVYCMLTVGVLCVLTYFYPDYTRLCMLRAANLRTPKNMPEKPDNRKKIMRKNRKI